MCTEPLKPNPNTTRCACVCVLVCLPCNQHFYVIQIQFQFPFTTNYQSIEACLGTGQQLTMALGIEQMSNLFRFRFRFDCDAIRGDCDCDAIVYLAIRVLNEGCGGGRIAPISMLVLNKCSYYIPKIET